MKLDVSKIQHFSVGDGPGIRTTVFLKGCNLRCPWCHNPETWSAEPQILRYDNINKEEICGKKLSIEEIVKDALDDKEFYDVSGGGVTVSGGEPMLQADGVAALAESLRESGVSVLIDTAGSVPYAAFEKTNPFARGYLLDYKTDQREKYALIGGDLRLIRENIQSLIRDGMDVRIRIPLIPNWNTDDAAVQNICGTLTGLGVETVDLIPYHRMGSGKYRALGISYAYENVSPLPAEQIEKIRQVFSEYFHTTVE